MEDVMSKKIEVSDETYEKIKDQLTEDSELKEHDLDYVLVRTYSAGVFTGFLESQNGKNVRLLSARRIWMWKGAASLSQLSMDGTSDPDGCKFPCEVDNIVLTEAIEIIDMTEKAKKSIRGVKIWEQ